MIVLIAISTLTLAASIPNWFAWVPPLMLLVPAGAAWLIRRVSLVASLSLAQVAIYFGVTWLILRQDRPPLLVALVVLWSSGIMLGALASRSRRPTQTHRVWAPPRLPHFMLATILLAIQAALILSAQVGFKAQLTLGASAPTGALGTLATTAPVVTLILVASALASGKRVGFAAVIALVQAVVLAMSGFRGASVVFILSVICTAALLLPNDSPWRARRRLTAILPALFMLLVFTFTVAARVKHNVATEAHASSAGNQLVNLRNVVREGAIRLDQGAQLSEAVSHRNDYDTKAAVAWRSQLEAGVPRYLWPGKPIVDYGQKVSVAVYGLKYGQSSSYLTSLGDTLVNFGTVGVLTGSFVLGLALALAEQRIRMGTGTPSLVLAAVVVYHALLGGDITLVLTLVGVLRGFAVAAVLWAAVSVLSRKRMRRVHADS